MCQVKFVDGSIDEMAMREVDKWTRIQEAVYKAMLGGKK